MVDGADTQEQPGDDALADELRRTLLNRLRGYGELLGDIVGGLDESRGGLKRALEVVARYPGWVRDSFGRAERDNPWYLRLQADRHLKHLHETVQEVDDFLLRAVEAEISPALTMAVERECSTLLDERRTAVVTVGRADNYGTFTGDLVEWLTEDLDLPDGTVELADIPSFAFVQVPRLEGEGALWRPIIAGHEIAHLAVEARGELYGVDWSEVVRAAEVEGLGSPADVPDELRVETLREWAQRWFEEHLCDAYAVHRFGPAAVAALGSFFHSSDAHGFGETHPPAWLRLELMLGWLEETVPNPLSELLEPWAEAALAPPTERLEPWVEFLIGRMRGLNAKMAEIVADWNASRFDASERVAEIKHAQERLTAGLPTIEHPTSDGQILSDADVLNGTWLAVRTDTAFPVEQLADYSLECLEFLEQWSSASEDSNGVGAQLEPPGRAADVRAGGVLSEEGIRARLDPAAENPLVVTPLLRGAIDGSAVDVRLGNKFVLFRSSRIQAFNPLSRAVAPSAMQTYVEKAWGQSFVLHPNELVLASVLEYVHLPADLMGEVVTRSSYGRLGLVTATATLVHPHYQGVLTLELVNLSEVPLTLTPGQRVAQLVLHTVSPPAPIPVGDKKYRCPVRPEFSKVEDDRDQEVLRVMGQQH